jgi:4-diphosphocytidyl-2-C-methyl-D-erythritol kinase
MNRIKLNSYAKINLFLDVINKREDGYHNIKSVMQRVNLYDKLEISENKSGIELICDQPKIPLDERNTCYKAASLIKDKFNINTGVSIKIRKTIPSGAGLAGGSSNAAAVIIGLNELWKLGMNANEMQELGLKVGADVAFCLKGETCLCEGLGDIITELKPFIWDNILIIKPSFSISTPLAYQTLTAEEHNQYKDNKILNYINDNDHYNTCMSVANTLELAAFRMQSQIPLIKEQLKKLGAISTLMTGSGSAVFGFYMDKSSIMKAYNAISKKYNRIFMCKTVNK